MTAGGASDAGGGGIAPRIAAAVLGLLGFVPLATLIPGGVDARWFVPLLTEWAAGTAIVIGTTVVLLIARRRYARLQSARPLDGITATWRTRPTVWTVGLPCAAALLYGAIAWFVFDGRPLFIDEIAQLIQTRIFGEGRLSRPVDPDPAFRSALLIADVNGRYFAHFPAGGPAVHLPGWMLGIPWLTVPAYGAIAVAVFVRWLRESPEPASSAPWAALLFAGAPFWAFMAATHMNHVPTVLALLVAMLGLARCVNGRGPRVGAAVALGAGLGVAATIRPLDALAFALPAAAWMTWRLRRLERGPLLEGIAAFAGVAVPLAVLFWINERTTGSPFLFGYDLLWGPGQGLGFHAAPWGAAHTPARGLEQINVYLLRLQSHFLETPFPALLPAFVALALWRGRAAFDRYLLASAALLLALYAMYWHEGHYLGPRFLVPLVPMLAIWTARAGSAIRARWSGEAHRAWVTAMSVAALIALGLGIPPRIAAYRQSARPLRWDVERAAARAGVRDALVFVRESWGAQLIARMWALGVARPAAEWVYYRADACRLEHTLSALERSGAGGGTATARLAALAGESRRLVPSPISPDRSERFDPAVVYDAICARRVAEDRAGFTFLAPLLLARDGGNIYLRDLHERNRVALRWYPGRPAWLLGPVGRDGAPAFRPLDIRP